MTSNPIDESIDVLDDVLSWGDTPEHILKNANVAITALRTLKSTHVIIAKEDLPEDVATGNIPEQLRPRHISSQSIETCIALITEQLGGVNGRN